MVADMNEPSAPSPDADLARLRELRHALLALHKALLEDERLRYEREHGRLEGGGRLLQLLVSDASFAWLRVLSALIVQIDERLDADEPLTAADVKQLRDEVRTAIVPDESGGDFQRNYARAL